MRALAAPVTAVALVAACGSADARPPERAADTRSGARLAIVSLSPLTVRGTSFVPGERVKLLVSTGKAASKASRADRRGRFTVRFAVELDRCTSFVVQAIGTRGSRAMTDITAPDCAKP